MYRNTYVKIKEKNIEQNARLLIEKNPGYQYYFGVVKADCYGHGMAAVSALLRAGINYLAVATLSEALEIRDKHPNIPVLILGYVPTEYLTLCADKNITITVPSLEYARKIEEKNLKCHIKINTGMNRLGISSKEEYEEIYQLLDKQVEGIYTHIYKASDEALTNRQLDLFEQIVTNPKEIPIIHVRASEATIRYPKRDFENGCRFGIILYNLIENSYPLKDTFSLVSEIIQIQELEEGETIGYDGVYQAHGKERIAIIPIGYADGIIRKNEGRNVYIHQKPYPIVGRICMDMLFVKIDEEVSLHDEVEVIRDSRHICEIAKHLETISYEVICSVGKRVPRIVEE